MARTPLLRSLERSLRLAWISTFTGRPPADLAEEVAAELAAGRATRRHLTRRDFLRTTAVVAGLGAAGCRTSRPGNGGTGSRAPDVLIIGAGIAGLTAGYRLKQAGARVRILEAQDRVGGRMYSLRGFFPDGQVAELGGELIDTGHAKIRGLATQLGIPLDDLHDEEPRLAKDVWYFDGRRISDAEVVEAYRPVAERIRTDLATLPEDPWPTYREPKGAENLDRMSLAEWLEGSGCDRWFSKLLDVAYTTEYGLELDRQSALNLLLLIDPKPDPFHIFGESDERFHTHGGNDRIPAELASRLEAEIETGAVLEAVGRRADGLFECSVRSGSASRTVAAPHVLLAIPFTTLRNVRLDVEIPAAKRRAIDELGYGTNAKLMLGFRERYWRTEYASNGSVLADLPFQLIWETSRKQPGAAGILTNFTGGEHGVAVGGGTAAEQAKAVVTSLEKVFPGITAAREGMKEVRFHWPTHPWTHGSYSCYLPGQWTTICGAEGERVGNLHFAGEHCSLEAQGYMEGGCETGEHAAAEILTDLGLARPEAAA